MTMDTQPASLSNGMFWAGWIISGLVMLFLAFDGVTKIIKVAPVVDADFIGIRSCAPVKKFDEKKP